MERPPDESPDAANPSPAEPVEPARQRTRGSLILGFTAAGFAIIVLSSLTTLVTEIPTAAEFGLLELLPWTYWVGMLLMGLAVFLAIRGGRNGLFAVAGALFFAALAGTPVLFEPNPPIWDAYIHLAEAQNIGLDGRLPAGLVEYSANWPGFFLTAWMASSAIGGAPLELLSLFPFLMGGLTFLALFVFLRSFFSPATAAIGSVLGSLLNVWAQFHLSPQSVGLILAFLVLATVWRRKTPFRIAAAVLFVGLVVSHPTSTILILGVIIADVALTYLLRIRRSGVPFPGKREKGFAYSPALAYGAVWVAWLFFQAAGSAQAAETALLTEIGNILQVPEQTLNLATARSLENLFVLAPLVRLGTLASFGIIAVIGLIVLTRREKSRRIAQFFWAALGSLVLFVLADILFFGGALYDRGLMVFALLTPVLGVAGLAALRLRKPIRQAILALFLLISLAAASTVYYQEAFYFVPDRAVAVSGFLDRAEPDSLVLDGFFPAPVWLDIQSRTRYTGLGFFIVFDTHFDAFGDGTHVYAVFDDTAELWYRQWRGIDVFQFYEDNRTRHSNIYADGRATIYLIFAPNSIG